MAPVSVLILYQYHIPKLLYGLNINPSPRRPIKFAHTSVLISVGISVLQQTISTPHLSPQAKPLAKDGVANLIGSIV
jgi:hypothetical protein